MVVGSWALPGFDSIGGVVLGDVPLVDRWHRGAKARIGDGWKSGCRSDKEKKHEGVIRSERQASRDERKDQRGARLDEDRRRRSSSEGRSQREANLACLRTGLKSQGRGGRWMSK